MASEVFSRNSHSEDGNALSISVLAYGSLRYGGRSALEAQSVTMQDLENSQDLKSALDRLWHPCDTFVDAALLEGTWEDSLAIGMTAPGPVSVIMVARYSHTPLYLEAMGGSACDFVVPSFGRGEGRG
jgi:hypothetical protein